MGFKRFWQPNRRSFGFWNTSATVIFFVNTKAKTMENNSDKLIIFVSTLDGGMLKNNNVFCVKPGLDLFAFFWSWQRPPHTPSSISPISVLRVCRRQLLTDNKLIASYVREEHRITDPGYIIPCINTVEKGVEPSTNKLSRQCARFSWGFTVGNCLIVEGKTTEG